MGEINDHILYLLLNLVQDLLNGNIEQKEFIISKTLKKTYKIRERISHVVLADRIQKRDPGNAHQINDRVPYVYIEYFKKTKVVGENIEDPEYAKQNNIKIDYLYYLEHQIMNPVCQILELLIETPQNLFIHAIEQEKENRQSKIRDFQNKEKGQKEISSFFTSVNKSKPPDTTIKIDIPDKISLKDKDKLIEKVKDKKEDISIWLSKMK